MIVPPKTFSSKVMLQIISHSVCELGHRRSEALRWFSQMALHRTHAPRALREVVHLKVGRPKKVWLSPQNSRLGHTIPFWKRLTTPGPKIYDMVIGGLHRGFHSSSIGKSNLTSNVLIQSAPNLLLPILMHWRAVKIDYNCTGLETPLAQGPLGNSPVPTICFLKILCVPGLQRENVPEHQNEPPTTACARKVA